MSVVIIGGNECMEGRYKQLCKKYNGKAKVFTKTKGALKRQIGNPDLLIMFIDTVSHKMMLSAKGAAERGDTEIVHAKSSSISSLKNILEEYTKSAENTKSISEKRKKN